MKRGVRGVTKSLRTLSTIYVFCEDTIELFTYSARIYVFCEDYRVHSKGPLMACASGFCNSLHARVSDALRPSNRRSHHYPKSASPY